MRLSDKISLITGGSGGIGSAIAISLASEGSKVAIADKNTQRCQALAEKISSSGKALALKADVSIEADVAAMVRHTLSSFGRIDILVNNAGVNLPFRAVKDLRLEEWEWVIKTNLTGVFLCCREVLPSMIKQGSGKIINISSSGGRKGAAGRSPYRASKAAIINFSECLAAEVKQYGIDVLTICPGAVRTEMLDEITGGNAPAYAMNPEDIAELAVFLASNESKALTGTAIDALGNSNPLFGVGMSYAQTKKE
jgi:NAD(P)-dependent dehydrogenase (short-subunit alcohol dehydrogenase family)